MTMNTSIPRIRLLPLTIFVAALMLSVKVGNLWQGFEALKGGGVSVASAEAQDRGAPPPPQQPLTPTPAEQPAPDSGQAGNETASVPPSMGDDPTLYTQAEIDLLQQLADRRQQLEERAQALEMQERLMKAAEARIDAKINEMKQLQATIESRLTTYDEQQEKKMGSLVKIYENMKPKDAAKIFEELDMNTLLDVAERMKERKLAPIMSSMAPAKAKEMTVELARLRELPKPGGDGG